MVWNFDRNSLAIGVQLQFSIDFLSTMDEMRSSPSEETDHLLHNMLHGIGSRSSHRLFGNLFIKVAFFQWNIYRGREVYARQGVAQRPDSGEARLEV